MAAAAAVGLAEGVSPAATSPAGPTLGQCRLSEDVLAAADLHLLYGVPAGHDPDVCPLPFGCGAFPVAARRRHVLLAAVDPALLLRLHTIQRTTRRRASGNDPRQVLMSPVLLPVCHLALAAFFYRPPDILAEQVPVGALSAEQLARRRGN